MESKIIDFKMKDRNIKLVSVFLIFLILFIFITTFFEEDEEVIQTSNTTQVDPIDEYKQQLETDILSMLSQMQGVGEVKVVITLENGVENFYVTEESFTNDISIDSKRNTGDTSILLVEDTNGKKQALLKTSVQPTVRGVVVVCQGGDNMLIVARVTQAIKALLNISSTKIYVTN